MSDLNTILWKVEKISDIILDESLLSISEKNQYDSFKIAKRKNEFLASRILAKKFISDSLGCKIIDVEIKSKIAHCVIEEANKKNKKVIASYHNFQQTPSEKNLIHICRQAEKLNADIVKIATFLKKEDDLFTLISVINKQRKRIPIVVIPMGSNILQRLVPIAFGSQFTYVALNKKTAPGQPDIREII
mgnify:CR=1 FL=1